MATYDSDFWAWGPTNIGYLAAGDIQVGGLFYGSHIGAQGSATAQQPPAGGVNFGLVGTAHPDSPVWNPGRGGPEIGVWGTSGNGQGVIGTSSLNAGVVGQSGDILVSGRRAGVVGNSQNVPGVYGVSSLSAGVVGESDEGSGVVGTSNATVGITGGSTKSIAILGTAGPGFGFEGNPATGVMGISNKGGPEFVAPAGVVGTSEHDQGVLGTSSSSSGVVGISRASSRIALVDPNNKAKSPPAGVFGTTLEVVAVAGVASKSSGVLGQAGKPPTNYTETIAGVIGASRDSAGVYGVSNAHIGVFGTSGSVGVGGIGGNAGVYGSSDSVGVQGDSNSSFGVCGTSKSWIGVFGYSVEWGPSVPNTLDPVAGVMGTSRNHPGVLGTSTNRAAVVGYSKTQMGVYAETGATGDGTYAGYFRGNLFVSGRIDAGIKDAIVPFPDGSHRRMHCMESPEHWFEDFGRARLKRGRVVVKLDADFAKVISPNDYRVFLTPEGDCQGLYYVRKRSNSFEVRELQGGTSSIPFSYRIVGQRRDIKRHKRFARIDIASPMQIMKPRTVGRTATRQQFSERKLFAAVKKHALALAAKPARGRKVRSRRQRKARA